MALLGNLPVTDPLHRGIVARFWQQPDIVVFTLCGFGIAELARRIPGPWAAASSVAVVSGPYSAATIEPVGPTT